MMKKSLLAIAITSLLLTACSKTENKAETQANASAPVEASANTTQTAEKEKNWAGEYKGTLPCADCEGIKTKLELNDDKTYELKETYLGKGDGNTFESKGTFTFDASNPSIVVLGDKADQRKFLIDETTATALDMDGKKVEGGLAEHYVLKKED